MFSKRIAVRSAPKVDGILATLHAREDAPSYYKRVGVALGPNLPASLAKCGPTSPYWGSMSDSSGTTSGVLLRTARTDCPMVVPQLAAKIS
jgi:hypothetical protein